jgi:glutamyl-tRNA synthetase
VGTAYVALFNLAFARRHGGRFLLRIEDTDRTRFDPRSEQAIFDALHWLGLQWDEGPDIGGPFAPYRQSERVPIYQDHAAQLVASGHAYPCFCTPQRLEQMRKEQQARGEAPRYDRHCRYLSPEDVAHQRAAGLPEVIRFAVPLDGETSWNDLVRGHVAFQNENLQDAVILKSDGFPTYHLAAVVDDHLMQISHVARAEEWVSSTPLHILMFGAFGWETPSFAHVPLLRNADRSKISKRKNPTSILYYRQRGYLPEALINFLAQLGWTMPDGREIFGFEDIVEHFDWTQMTPAGPVFDLKRLDWYNGVYIRKLDDHELARRLQPFVSVPAGRTQAVDLPFLERVAPILRERITLLSDAPALLSFFFTPPSDYLPEQLVGKKHDRAETREALLATTARLCTLPDWTAAAILQAVRDVANALNWSLRELFAPTLYVAITGSDRGLPLPESMEILGRDESCRRLEVASARLGYTP